MKVKVDRIINNEQEESANLKIFEITPNIENAIALLQNENYIIEAENIDEGSFEKLKFSQIIYVEYLERNIYLYTADTAYSVHGSLTNFMKNAPNSFIQISKSVMVNLYFMQSFAAQNNGNLVAEMASNEKLIVSRRYVKKLKDKLAEISKNNRM